PDGPEVGIRSIHLPDGCRDIRHPSLSCGISILDIIPQRVDGLAAASGRTLLLRSQKAIVSLCCRHTFHFGPVFPRERPLLSAAEPATGHQNALAETLADVNGPSSARPSIPFRPPLVKAGLISRSSPSSLLRKWLAGLSAEGKIRSQEVKISCKVLPLQPPHRTYGERLIAIGDAAGHVKPTTGGGIYYGLIGAEMACNVLQDALADDDLSARRLSRYERSWRQKLGREIKTGHWGRELFERLSERQIDLLFEIIRSAGIDEALLKASDISFDWHSRSIIALLKYRLITQAIRPSRWLWHSRPR
ncbi:MAG: hypothetical protein ONB05_01000, partial [candidate division KSB1 bacterium]|nr:hypothetical protein [candidate division KSB1 bacterium]